MNDGGEGGTAGVGRWLLGGVFVLLVAGALVGGILAGGRPDVRLTPPFRKDLQVGPFELVDQGGGRVTEAELRGRILVVSFVFTSCSVSCLQVSHNMARIQESLEGANDVRMVSITVDPREDQPPVLRQFAAKFNADHRRWMFLTGEPARVHAVLRSSFLEVDGSGGYNPMPGGYTDADRIAVVDGAGRVRGYVRGTQPEAVDQVLAAVNALRSEQRRGGGG